MTSVLKDRHILLGISGGIAAYKAIELLRRLSDGEAQVAVVMTRNAQRFVTPLTFQALTPQGVYTDLFDSYRPGAMDHIQLAEWVELIVLAPATANLIAKAAHGLADDLLSTFLLACPATKLFCPAMNVRMYENQVVQANLTLLKNQGNYILEPSSGILACGQEGKGRLPDTEVIFEEILGHLSPPDLKGDQVLITAGCTWEPLDPVRFISNPSTGKMGFSLARVARRRGARVTLVTGPTHLDPVPGITTIPVKSALEMEKEVLRLFPSATIVVKAAAVSDYRPQEVHLQKVKKKEVDLHLNLVQNPDILHRLGQNKKNQFLVGFAAETEDLLNNALQKLREKNLDLIVANPIGKADAGFGSDTNQVLFLFPDGKTKSLPVMLKDDVASLIFDTIVKRRGPGNRDSSRS
ncbi:MAG: bifunctional phosphopantothenoylcysteine decarboxylase/phosphopantothenate--cysteine ligase CoaBC [Desulfobacca sp.]|nr:bifunctional phosphopantothenoylcysteine decarboxylase/phosphopantothenate--cysteine ligase CoaBC [Desulfobacca sp.]